MLSGIARAFPGAQLRGSEIFTAGLTFAAARLPATNLMQMDARNIPFVDEFDTIGAFDVLEHIEADTLVLAQIYDALKPHGVMLLTVPQHPWLWSHVDDYSCHVRRYSAKELCAKIEGAGFKILRTTSFVSSLLPAMFVSRMMKKRTTKGGAEVKAESRMPLWLNRTFEIILGVEIYLIRKGINFPLGGSRLIVARKI